MKYHVIVNPAGASGKTLKLWSRYEEYFKNARADYDVHYSNRETGIGGVCERLENEHAASGDPGLLAIITVGGDGSVNDAVNSFRDLSRIAYAHLPGGSGNDMLRDMDLPSDRETLIRRILEGRIRRRFDVGEITCVDTGVTRRFAVSSGIGFDAGVCEAVNRSPHKATFNRLGVGKLIYVADAFKVIGTQTTGRLTLTTDSGTFEYENLLLMAIMNHQYEGGGVHFAPEADATDGLLDLCIAAPKHRSYFYQALPFAMVGQHEKLAYITPIKTSSLEARVSVPMWVQTDGEVLPQSQHIKVRVLEKKLQSLM